jgi:hypothetical protein
MQVLVGLSFLESYDLHKVTQDMNIYDTESVNSIPDIQ